MARVTLWSAPHPPCLTGATAVANRMRSDRCRVGSGRDGKLHVPFSCGDEICHDEFGQGVDPMEVTTALAFGGEDNGV